MWSHLSAQSEKIVYMGVAWLQFGYIINLAFLALIRSVDDVTLWHPPSPVDQTMRLAAGVTTENRKAVRSGRGGGEWEQEAQRITRPLPFPETPPSPPLSLPLSSTSASPPRLAPSLARSLLSLSRGGFERKTIIQGTQPGWLESCWVWGSAKPFSRGMRWREREWRREEREDLPLPLRYEQVSELLSSEPTGALFICCTCRIGMGITATLPWCSEKRLGSQCTIISACISDWSVQRCRVFCL